jgi:hypothetical protein
MGGGDGVFTLDFGTGETARTARVRDESDLPYALEALGLTGPRTVVVVIGGAGGMDDIDAEPLLAVLAEALLPVVIAHDAVVVDGGTDSGVMRMVGRMRDLSLVDFALAGVAAEGTVVLPGQQAAAPGAAQLDRHHSQFLLVPGDEWGDETPWLARVATAVAGPCPSVTVLINGGKISFDDASESLAAERPVLVLDGTGRTADRIAAAAHGERSDGRAVVIADSPRLFVAPVSDPASVRAALEALLRPSG